MTPTTADIEVRHVSLDLGKTAVLDDVSFQLSPGTICGLLGRNGSGKTSLLSLLASCRRPTSGEVLIGGADPFEDAERMAQVLYVGEAGDGDSTSDVSGVFRVAEALHPAWDSDYAATLLERFQVPTDTNLDKLSRGQRASVGVCVGLAARAPITLFDEPHLGMDVPSRLAFYDELLVGGADHPRTVIFATHHIDEAASLFSDVVILDGGRCLLHADADELRARAVEVTGPSDAVGRITTGLPVLAERHVGGHTIAVVDGGVTDRHRTEAREAGVTLSPVPLQELVAHLTDRHEVTS